MILLFVCWSCTSTNENQGLQLESTESKREFLEQLFDADQKLRQGQSATILINHGKDSEVYKEFISLFIGQDSINVVQTENYLNKFGYPAKAEFGEIASAAPWTVIHHSNDLDIRNRNFHFIQDAYLKKDIDDSAMSMYLGKTYELTFGERFEMPSPFKNSDRIDKLIEILEVGEVDKARKR